MYVQERIISRKILVMTVYEQLVRLLPYSDSFMLIIDIKNTIDYHFPLFATTDLAIDHMGYMCERFFDGNKTHTIDIEFLKKIIVGRNSHIDTIVLMINKHCTTFSFEKMDPMDKALFLCGCIEYKMHQTPKQILLNEMIEIAKRYGDEGSPKLINGIGHKVLDDL